MVIPLFVGREKSINALDAAMEGDKEVLLAAQKHAADDNPDFDAMYEVGTVATILQLLKLPDGTVKVLVEGSDRVKLISSEDNGDYLQADAEYLLSGPEAASQSEVLMRTTLAQFEQYVELGKKVPSDVLNSVTAIEDADRLADTIASHIVIPIEKKQKNSRNCIRFRTFRAFNSFT
jgi:ATP-dependent Lon protease